MIAHQTIKPAPIFKRLEVKAPLERTFDTFVARMGDWWPRDHSLVGDKVRTAVIIDPHAGGRWYETADDGSEIQWGAVRVFDRPNRVLLVWQLNAEFTYESDFETEVEVCFSEVDGVTIVEFEHRDMERFGGNAEKTRTEMDGGWAMILDQFVASAEG